MAVRVVQVDAFTAKAFAGNPAAVCVMEEPADEQWMKNVAREMNLSETAFLYPEFDGYRLRWLTPTIEVDLCGHATLASAHVLWEEKHIRREEPAKFYTRSGLLTCRAVDDWIEMDFPIKERLRPRLRRIFPRRWASNSDPCGEMSSTTWSRWKTRSCCAA